MSLELANWVKANPPESIHEHPETVLYMRPGEWLTVRRTTPRHSYHYGYDWNEAVMATGKSSSEEASKQFAKSLLETLSPHLTRRNLQDLAVAFGDAYHEALVAASAQ